jgi:hypothetical protein
MITVSITREDIDEGCRTDAFNCPAAVAINRMLPPGYTCGVTSCNIHYYLSNKSAGQFERTPPVLAEFVRTFDAEGIVDPITFELKGLEQLLNI